MLRLSPRIRRYDALSLDEVAKAVVISGAEKLWRRGRGHSAQAMGYVKKADKEKPYYANFVKRLGAAEPMSSLRLVRRACERLLPSRAESISAR